MFRATMPVLIVSLALALAGCASTPKVVDPTPEIRAAHGRLVAAFNACDEAAFAGAYAPGFTFTTSDTPVTITSVSGLRGYLSVGCRQVPSPQVTVKGQAIKYEGDFGIVTGQYVFRMSSRGEASDVTQNYTLVMQRVADGWRATAHHVSLAR